MGLDAKVYRSINSLPRDVETLGAIRDDVTGEYYFEDQTVSKQFPLDFSVAVHKRLGNIDAIAELRNEVGDILPRDSILYEKFLQNATRSGDVIEYGQLDQLEREVGETLHKAKRHERALLREFLDTITELVRIARREKNPIVIV